MSQDSPIRTSHAGKPLITPSSQREKWAEMSLQGTYRGWSRQSPETEADFDFSTALIKQPPKQTNKQTLLGTVKLPGNGRLRVGKDHGRRTEKRVQIPH